MKIKSFKQLDKKEYEFVYEDVDLENDNIKLVKSGKGYGWMLETDNINICEEELEKILAEIKRLNKSK